jgi:predicted Zn-dependent protease
VNELFNAIKTRSLTQKEGNMDKEYIIKIKNKPLFLHKSSNMFTTNVKQARKYKTEKNAKKWIDSRDTANGEYNEYNYRFNGLEFIITEECRL